MVIDEPLHLVAVRCTTAQPLDILLRVLRHHEVSTPADVYHPANSSEEHGDGCFVDSRQVACRYQQIGQKEHGDDNESHLI